MLFASLCWLPCLPPIDCLLQDATQTFVGQQVDQNRQLMQLSRQLQREVAISGNEVKLLENEQSRLRDENAELRREVSRLDRIIYGKAGSKGKPSAR